MVTYSRELEIQELRGRVLRELREAGFRRRAGRIKPVDSSKAGVRGLHSKQRQALLLAEKGFIHRWEDRLLPWFANGQDVEPDLIFPEVVPVVTPEQTALFRYVSLTWSIPVSSGYGRRTRFLVFDTRNDKLIGIFALGDPVYNLTARDAAIGWTVEQRSERLYAVLDAFVLGAVSPYRELLAGKLIAMSVLSDEVLDYIQQKYEGRVTEIKKRTISPRPVLITTTSALGRSSLYNRIKLPQRLLYESVGFTQGYGHFQFSSDLFKALCEFLDKDDALPGHRYGQGPNWRFRALRTALARLELDPELLQHGVKREVFLAPTAENWREYLRGETVKPRWSPLTMREISDYFARRWAIPRAGRDASFREATPDDLKLSAQLQQES